MESDLRKVQEEYERTVRSKKQLEENAEALKTKVIEISKEKKKAFLLGSMLCLNVSNELL